MTASTRRLLTFCLLPSALCLLPAFCLPAAAAPDDPGIDADILTLADPHASPSEKVEAAQRLGDKGPEARRAIPALLRQTRYNMEHVRAKARQSLDRVAGPAEAQRLLGTAKTDDDYRDAVKGALLGPVTDWHAEAQIQRLLQSTAPDAPRIALDALHKLATSNPRGIDTITEWRRDGLAASLEYAAAGDPDLRGEIVPLIELVGPARAPSVRFLLRCSLDASITGNPALRDQVRRLLADALDRTPRAPSALAGLAGLADILTDPNPAVAAAAAAQVSSDLAADPAFKSAVAAAVAAKVAAGNADAAALLKRYDVPPDAFVRRAFARMTTGQVREQLNLLRALPPDAARAAVEERAFTRHLLVGYLVDFDDAGDARSGDTPHAGATRQENDDLAAAAAQFLTGPSSRRAVRDAVEKALLKGRTPSGRSLQVAQFDPRELTQLLRTRLSDGPAASRLAAARTLATLGVAPDDATTRAALDRALRTLDTPDLRHAAADALNTPQAHDLARLPDLLSDLRAARPSTRQLAARQIQGLNLFEPAVIAALVRATDAGDLATREGLCLALEGAFLDNRPARDVLTELASAAATDTPATRAYARAALRTIDPQH